MKLMRESVLNHPSFISRLRSPWLWTGVLCLILLALLILGRWRSTATGAQVQVPMFYDAHYLFPQPWTQAQAAPGMPAPFPVAFYGPNTISQSFISGADNLEMVEIWLSGPVGTAVTATLTTGDQRYTGQIHLAHEGPPRPYRLAFPRIAQAEGHTFWLALAAPAATAEQPVITQAIGGDKLGGAVRLNEFPRPGNMRLATYVTGTAVPDALLEQFLPDLFRLRLQQYKVIKGEWFAGLLGAMVALTGVYLVLARPSAPLMVATIGWALTGLLAGFLVWQLGDGRVRLPAADLTLTVCDSLPGEAGPCVFHVEGTNEFRVANSMTLTLWTAKREPEERFVTTTLVEGAPAINAPGDSLLGYTLTVPPHGRFVAEASVTGDGRVRFAVLFGDAVLAEHIVSDGDPPYPFDVDLSSLAGQGGDLRLVTELVNGTAAIYWRQPQLLVQTNWLLADLPAAAYPAGHRLGTDVALVGYTLTPAVDQLKVTLYWQTTRPLATNAVVFVHLLDETGRMVAQHDAQPVQNSYPLTFWPVRAIIADEHIMPLPDRPYTLAVGLYDPHDLTRWSVANPDGTVDPDGRALLPGDTP